ncbi:hypothetical protein [Streptomyces gobiensis]|uniref:hypothetical protein n=1 Tax=Streptomyces gobiensis TaxID=2875706 RepID=UPI001E50ACC2|nr:hypothetical protein [Streptomyces gobiensis]UGY92684.1 hypothetical protein test1122_13775 [Streptomyces gobiensis]
MPSPLVRRITPALTTACTVLLTACAGTPESGNTVGEPDPGEIPVMLETKHLEFPLGTYEATNDERRKLSSAQDALVVECMSRFGFAYTPPPQQTAPATDNRYIFGVVDAKEVARYGYGNPLATAAAKRKRPARPALSSTERLVLGGADDTNPQSLPMSQEAAQREGGSSQKVNGQAVPVGGCSREAFLKLYAPKPNAVDIMYVFNLRSEAESQTRADSRVRANDKKWSACMKKSGYSVTNPMDAANELGIQNEELSSPDAIAAATADIACKKKVNLVGVRYAVTTAYQKRLIDKNAETLNLARQQHEDRMKLAATLLS